MLNGHFVNIYWLTLHNICECGKCVSLYIVNKKYAPFIQSIENGKSAKQKTSM